MSRGLVAFCDALQLRIPASGTENPLADPAALARQNRHAPGACVNSIQH